MQTFNKIALLFVVLAASLCPVARAADAASPKAFDDAAQAYDAGKFGEAREDYESLVSAGNYSANLFYDIGNCWFRLGDPGRAILNYERALALEPGHPEARANVAFVREQTGALVEGKKWMDYVAAPFDSTVMTWTATVAAWVALFALVFIFTGKPGRSAAPVAVIVAAFLVLAFAGVGIARYERDKAVAIVTVKQAEARLEPLDNSGVVATLPPGSRVRVLSDRGPWLYCSLPDESRGWMASKSVEKVRLTRS